MAQTIMAQYCYKTHLLLHNIVVLRPFAGQSREPTGRNPCRSVPEVNADVCWKDHISWTACFMGSADSQKMKLKSWVDRRALQTCAACLLVQRGGVIRVQGSADVCPLVSGKSLIVKQSFVVVDSITHLSGSESWSWLTGLTSSWA